MLPESWQRWLQENLQRGCPPEQLLDTLRQNGFAEVIDAMASRLQQPDGPWPDRPHALLAASLRQIGVNVLPAQGLLQPRLRLQLRDPLVVLLDGVLSVEECNALMALADPRLHSSTVVASDSGQAVPDQRRSSAGVAFVRGSEVLASEIEARIAQWLDYPVERVEGLQVLRYGVQGEYRPHFDFFDPERTGSARHLAHGGQRVLTVILYLSEVTAGGATAFPELGLTIPPHQGSALVFANVQPDGQPEQRSLHAGLPVLEGCKYIATLWWRERAYTAPEV